MLGASAVQTEGPATRTSPQHEVRVRRGALMAGFALLTLLRAPWLVVAPRFFAEEGIVYFRYALSHGVLDTLTAKHLAYYALVPNVATAIAARLPLALAPYATLAFAFAVQLIPAFIIVHDRELWKTQRDKVLALLVLLVPLAMRREWLSTIHAQFWLALAMCLMLVVKPRSRSALALYALTTLTAALTGALSDALAPCFLLLGLVRRDPRLLASGAVLGAGALFQAQSIATARALVWDARDLLSVAAGKLIAVPLAGKFAAPLTVALFTHAHSPLVFGLTALGAAAAFFVAFRALDQNGKVLLVVSTYLGIASLVAALGDHAALAQPLHGVRYVFVPNVVYGLLLVWALSRANAPRWPIAAALGTIIFVGIVGAASAARVLRRGRFVPARCARVRA
jgi:hypothetical protein